MKIISNVEFMLLLLIAEKKKISGYEINRLIEERGFRNWADIGTTSIYVGLEKLKKKKCLEFFYDIEKTGKGPVPKMFHLNLEGKKVLRKTICDALVNSRERDKRFDLGLVGLPFISSEKAASALQKRKEILLAAENFIKTKFKSDGGESLPFHVKAVFSHPLFLIKHELDFTDTLIKELESKTTMKKN